MEELMPTTAEVVKTKPNETTLSLASEKEHLICYTVFSSHSFKNSGRLWRTQEDRSKLKPFSNV